MTSEAITFKPSRARTIVFWVATVILIVGMLAGGASQLLRAEIQVKNMQYLGYPLILLSLIGAGKILGAIVLLIPRRFPLLKVAAYVGVFIVTVSATISHIAVGDYGNAVSPVIVAGIAVTACLLNPSIEFVRKDGK